MFCLFPHPCKAADKSFTVVLDAGHGGKDPGTIGSHPSHREKDIAFNITMAVGKLLNKKHPNIKVVYTRQTDVFVELGRRAEIANKAKADLFVSIHVNSLPQNATRRVTGVQSYTLSLKTAETNLEVEKRENSVIAMEGEAAKKYNYNASAESNIMFGKRGVCKTGAKRDDTHRRQKRHGCETSQSGCTPPDLHAQRTARSGLYLHTIRRELPDVKPRAIDHGSVHLQCHRQVCGETDWQASKPGESGKAQT